MQAPHRVRFRCCSLMFLSLASPSHRRQVASAKSIESGASRREALPCSFQPAILPIPTTAPMPWRSMTHPPCSRPAGPAWSARTEPARARCSRSYAGCSSPRKEAFLRRSQDRSAPSRPMSRQRGSRTSPTTTAPRPCACATCSASTTHGYGATTPCHMASASVSR